MAIPEGSGRDVEYDVQPSNPGGDLAADDNLWTLLLRWLGLA